MATYVAVFALVLAYAALVAAYAALRTLAKLRRATRVLAKGARGEESHASLLETTQRHDERIEVVSDEVEALRGHIETMLGTTPGDAPGALRNIALVRYDAFTEMSGRMSFSLALLDEKGDGVALSAIAGAGDTRVYAKGVSAGKGEHELSPEEQQAVSAALAKRRSLLARRAS
ncbi:Protein of unknown function [Jatrophihabitans endophyticus]|uniref:DUF4446 domain-containing protein n=1 Tax=Jatrophihabitans endophyticus TaxID=1206085 RepID=A0A1M5I0D0_9ACTN|nr:DUF4446 family protein [Jatrophihabitans endophyticus]SHG21764.1 Protein of unknown function [Jatrophihabitans endophyticus]